MTKKADAISKIAGIISDAIDAAIDGIAAAGIQDLPPNKLMATLIAFEVIAKDGIRDTAEQYSVPQSAIDAMRVAMTEVFSGMMESVKAADEVKH